jgi:hypothetical protein
MHAGKFEDIMPFNKQEQDVWIKRLDETLAEGKIHLYTNFEICDLRAIKAMQQENNELRTELETTKHIAIEQTEAAIDLQQEDEQLQAQNKVMQEALDKVFYRNVVTGKVHCFLCGAINSHTPDCPIGKAISATHADKKEYQKPNIEPLSGTQDTYHNPADVEALAKAKEAIITLMSCNEISKAADIMGEESLAAIVKIGGREK